MAENTQGSREISPAQIAVMKKVATDPNFRTTFFKDPAKAVAGANLKISSTELGPLARLNPTQYDNLQRFVRSNARTAAEGTHTLAYAVALAVAFALLFLVASPTQSQTVSR